MDLNIKKLLIIRDISYNRKHKKAAEAEYNATISRIMPNIERFLESERTEELHDKHNKIFVKTANSINNSNVYIYVNDRFFTDHVDSVEFEKQILKKNRKPILFAVIIIFIILLLISLPFIT